MTHPAFAQTDHRPWPVPDRPWGWRQVWLDLAFIHFEADAAAIRRHLPAGLELDTFDGRAWIGLVPFRMEGVTRRGLPAPRWFCDFPEFNVRTYVTRDGKPGVWFFSLDVPNATAVWAARTFFHLPYYRAAFSVRRESHGTWDYRAQRDHRAFAARYRPVGERVADPGAFGAWSTERYCLYTQSRRGVLYRGEIQHPRWPLQRAELELSVNRYADLQLGPRHPDVWFSPRVDVVVWPLDRLAGR